MGQDISTWNPEIKKKKEILKNFDTTPKTAKQSTKKKKQIFKKQKNFEKFLLKRSKIWKNSKISGFLVISGLQ